MTTNKKTGKEFCDPQSIPAPDEYGLFVHPDLRLLYGKLEADLIEDYVSFELMREVLDSGGYDYESVLLMETSDPKDIDSFYSHETIGMREFIARWRYQPKEHLNLVAVYDTDYGPAALFVGKKPIIEEPA